MKIFDKKDPHVDCETWETPAISALYFRCEQVCLTCLYALVNPFDIITFRSIILSLNFDKPYLIIIQHLLLKTYRFRGKLKTSIREFNSLPLPFSTQKRPNSSCPFIKKLFFFSCVCVCVCVCLFVLVGWGGGGLLYYRDQMDIDPVQTAALPPDSTTASTVQTTVPAISPSSVPAPNPPPPPPMDDAPRKRHEAMSAMVVELRKLFALMTSSNRSSIDPSGFVNSLVDASGNVRKPETNHK